MNRRDFVKFMGISSATVAASTALAKIPEAESKIILLDKPKEIILAKTIPDVDFVITNLVSINYIDKNHRHIFESVDATHNSTLTVGERLIEVKFEYYEENINLIKRADKPLHFSFDLNIKNTRWIHLNELNGRRFLLKEHSVGFSTKTISTAEVIGIEVTKDLHPL